MKSAFVGFALVMGLSAAHSMFLPSEPEKSLSGQPVKVPKGLEAAPRVNAKPTPNNQVLRRLSNGAVVFQPALVMEMVPPPDESNAVKIGQGWDPATGYTQSICTDASDPDDAFGQYDKPGQTEGIDVGFYEAVSDVAKSESASKSGNDFSLTYKVVTFGFKEDDSWSRDFNSVDQFGRVYRRIATNGYVRWYPKWAKGINPTMADFADRCGTHFVKAIYYGHVLDEVVTFKMASASYASSDHADFSIGIDKLFRLGHNDSDTQTKINNNFRVSIVDRGNRGVVSSMPTPTGDANGVQAVVAYARSQFADRVASAPPSTIVVGVDVASYKEVGLPGTAAFSRWSADIVSAFLDASYNFKVLMSIITDLRFASSAAVDAQRSNLYAETPDTLKAKLTSAERFRSEFQAEAETCHNEIAKPNQNSARNCSVRLRKAVSEERLDCVRPHRLSAGDPVFISPGAATPSSGASSPSTVPPICS